MCINKACSAVLVQDSDKTNKSLVSARLSDCKKIPSQCNTHYRDHTSMHVKNPLQAWREIKQPRPHDSLRDINWNTHCIIISRKAN